jgi:predicted metal-dependent hydrolase
MRRGAKKHFHTHKQSASELVHARLAHFNRAYNFSFKRVFIRNQRTRWASCSKRGNLSFNYKIALLPPELADYIIVHELCHLIEFNHSPNFWALVAKTIPDHRVHRRSLRTWHSARRRAARQ